MLTLSPLDAIFGGLEKLPDFRIMEKSDELTQIPC
jgi:hypothetical protein